MQWCEGKTIFPQASVSTIARMAFQQLKLQIEVHQEVQGYDGASDRFLKSGSMTEVAM